MPGRGHFQSLTERILRTLRANTTRTAGGLASNASPGLTRDRLVASRRSTSGVTPSLRRHWHDDLKPAGDAPVSEYTLTFQPADPPHWPQVFAGEALQHIGTDYDLSGRTLTPLTAMRLRDADLLYCDYDYLQTVPSSPTDPVVPPPPGSAPSSVSPRPSTEFRTTKTIFLPTVAAGDTLLVIGVVSGYVSDAGFSAFTTHTPQVILGTPGNANYTLAAWSKVCDGTEGGDTVSVTAAFTTWIGLHTVVYGQCSPTYIDGDGGGAPDTDYTTPAAAASDGWAVYVVGHAYADIVKSNAALVTDMASTGTQHRVAVFHAVDTEAAEDFTASNTYGWASHILTMEG